MTAVPLPRRVRLRRVADGLRSTASPATPARSRPRPRRVVVAAPTPAQHPLLLTVVSLTVLVAAVFGAVTLNAIAADDAVRARELELEIRDAEIAYGQMLADVAALESPARIAAAAEALGLERVDTPRLLTVDRLLPADGAADVGPRAGDRTDRLKPLLADD